MDENVSQPIGEAQPIDPRQGLKILKHVGAIVSVTIGGLADEWISYILPAEEYRKGGYEASVSFYGETLGSTVMDGLLRAASGLK